MKKLIVLAALLIASVLPARLIAQKKPNIVFIFTDDLGYTDPGCYGNPYHRTPRIDQLASEGVRFTQAYAASPICSASRAALMTGRHPARLHLTNYLVGLRTDSLSPVLPAPFRHYLPSSEKTLAQFLTEEGYTAGIVGKWHLGSGDSIAPVKRGFQYERVISKNGLDYYNYGISSEGKTVFEDNGTEYITDKLTDYGVEFIRDNKEKPFFLYLAYSAPHVMIVPKGNKLRPYLMQYEKFKDKFNPYYAALLESLDDGVGRILDTLKALGLDDNTLVVFTSDNGGVGLDELGPTPTNLEPLRAWKGHVYEGGTRVPTLVRWPGQVPAGKVSESVFTNIDYLPTLLAATGSRQAPTNLDGQNVLPAWLEPEREFDRGPVYWHYPHFSNQMGRPAGAVRVGNFKLVEEYETGQTALYDLSRDISEQQDLATLRPEVHSKLQKLLKDWQQEVRANMPVPNPNFKTR